MSVSMYLCLMTHAMHAGTFLLQLLCVRVCLVVILPDMNVTLSP